MNVLGCLDVADGGSYVLAGENVNKLSDDQLASIRNKHIGFVFQTYNLLSRLNAIENVELPLIYGGDRNARRQRALAALEQVGRATASITGRASSPAVSSSASRSRARSSTTRR